MTDPGGFKSLLVRQVALFGLMGANVLIFALELFLPEALFAGFRCVPVEVMYAWHQLLSGQIGWVELRELGTLLTYAFLHADIEHLAFNLLYLWIFGYLAGELLGQRWVVLLYLLTAIGGGICYVIFNAESDIPMLGASGAVLGFQGAYLGLAVRCALPDPYVWPLSRPVSPMTLGIFAIIGVFLDLSGTLNPGMSNTAFATHLGGFLTGIFLTSFVTPVPGARR